MNRSLRAGALVAFAVFGSAFSLLSPARSWTTTPVYVGVYASSAFAEASIRSPDPDFGVTSIIDALNDPAGWNGAASGLIHGYSATSWSLNDGAPTVVFNDPLGVCTGSCLAATLTSFWHDAGGAIVIDDADVFVTASGSIVFDSEVERPPGTCSGSYYIEGVVMHEVGHVLGLGHSRVSGATMASSARTCDPGLDAIAPDDARGVLALY